MRLLSPAFSMEVVATDMVALKGGIMAEIVKTIGREILDSTGNPTVEADVWLPGGSMGRAAARFAGKQALRLKLTKE